MASSATGLSVLDWSLATLRKASWAAIRDSELAVEGYVLLGTLDHNSVRFLENLEREKIVEVQPLLCTFELPYWAGPILLIRVSDRIFESSAMTSSPLPASFSSFRDLVLPIFGTIPSFAPAWRLFAVAERAWRLVAKIPRRPREAREPQRPL